MKNITILIISFLIQICVTAQNKIAITLRDGNVIEGYGRVKRNNKIIYFKEKDGKKIIYDYKSAKSVVVFRKDNETRYAYKVVTKGDSSDAGSVRLLPEQLSGKVVLYSISTAMSNPQIGFYTVVSYYISKEDSDIAISLEAGNIRSDKFMQLANKYFSDCPDLLEKLRNKYFKRYDLGLVVEYYNNDCK